MSKVADNVGIEETDEVLEEEDQRLKEQAIKDNFAVAEVMNTEGGRHFVWLQLCESGVYRDAFDADPYIHARNAGDKAAGLRLLHKILSVCPEEHQRMFTEHQYSEENDEKQ